VPAGGTASTAPQDTQPAIDFYWIRPGTTLTKVPNRVIKTNKKSKKVTIKFTSTDAAPTFLCQIDSKAEKPCVSPTTLTLKRGRHNLKVRSVAEDGNEDVTPATTKVRIKKK
jgi:hypothetical protein